MRKPFMTRRVISRWGRVMLLSAPLLISCAQSSSAQNSSNTAANEMAEDADMKEIILNVTGMT